MRQRMVRVGHADLRIRPPADFARQHECADPGQVGLIGQREQIHHQHCMLGVGAGDPHRLVDHGQLPCILRLRHLETSFDVSHRLEILVEPRPVGPSQYTLQVGDLLTHEVQHAAVAVDPLEPRPGVGAAARPEQSLEDRPRIVLAGKRRRRRTPRKCVRQGAARPVAVAQHGHRIEGKFERRQLGLLPELPRGDLIHRHTRMNVGIRDCPIGNAGQIGARRACMVTTSVRQPRRLVGQPADNQDLFAIAGQ